MALLDSIRNRPNFFLIGAAKAGTTRLHYLLAQHPDIFGSSRKEPNFFNCESPSQEQCEEYCEYFREVGTAAAVGESSVSYSRSQYFPGTARRIFEFNPAARIIYIVRHPLKRIESDWIEARAGNTRVARDFLKAVRYQSPYILDSSLYWKQLSEYREYFPDRQILLLFFEEYIQDEASTLRRFFDFLGVDPDVAIDTSMRTRQNSSDGKQAATSLRDYLRNVTPVHRAWTGLPQSVKDKVAPALLWRASTRPVWDEATWMWAAGQLRPDSEKFLAHAGRAADYWKWDFEAVEEK